MIAYLIFHVLWYNAASTASNSTEREIFNACAGVVDSSLARHYEERK